MMIGDSIISAIGETTPANAARLISGKGRRAIAAESAGSSTAISSQLIAKGHQMCATWRTVTGFAVACILSELFGDDFFDAAHDAVIEHHFNAVRMMRGIG